MDILKFKIPLYINLPRPIKKGINGYSTYSLELLEIDFNSLYKDEIEALRGQYDWIDVCLGREEYGKRTYGFSNKDVLMEVAYSKGFYFVTLVSDKPFNTIVERNFYSYKEKEKMTLKEAVIDFINGCLSDGIGENEIGYVTYQYEKCDVWLGNLIEI